MIASHAAQLAELRSTLGKMETALAAISDAIAWVGPAGDIQWCNAVFDRLVGRPHIMILGMNMAAILPLRQMDAPISEKAHPAYRALHEKGEVAGLYEFIRDEKRTLEITCRHVTPSETSAFVLVVIRDVTTTGEIEKYRLLNAAVMTAANAIAITDRRGDILWINPAFTRLTGYSIEEVYQKNFRHIKSGLNPPGVYAALWNTILKGDVWTGRLKNRRKDGCIYIEEQTITPVRDNTGEIAHFIAVKLDVTEDQRIQDKLKLLSLVASKTDNAVVITDKEGRTEWVNEGFTRITGYTLAEVVGKRPGEILQGPLTDPDTVADIRRNLREGKSFSTQLINYTKKGRPYWLQFSVTPIYDEEGRVTRHIAIESDITEQKQAEQRLREYQEQLEQMVEARTRALRQAQSDLIAGAIESGRAQAAAMVLHNIGNAVTPFQIYIEQMERSLLPGTIDYLDKCYRELADHKTDLTGYVSEDPRGVQVFDYFGKLIHAARAQADGIRDNIEKMQKALGYISEIITLQQAYAPSEKENRERVDINGLVENAFQMQMAALDKRGIKVLKQLDRRLTFLVIDKNRLMQVLVNLIKNAYEAIDARADAASGEIRVLTYGDGSDIVIELADSGVGIEPQDAASLFTFGKSRKGSSGFGLYYCKLFVENNGGTIRLTSTGKGGGVTVTIRLPLEQKRKEK